METLACLAGYYPPSALNDNEGLTRFTQLAWHHALVTWPHLWRAVQKLNFYRLSPPSHKQQKRLESDRIYSILFRSRLDFSVTPRLETREVEEEMGMGRKYGREKNNG